MNDASPPLRTLRLPERQREQLLEALEKRSLSRAGSDRRDLRLRYNRGACEATISGGENQATRHVITPRNLSRRGFAFIHGQYVHRGARCCIDLVDLDEWAHRIRGSVARCQHLSGIIHEVTVIFDDPIELHRFIELDASQQRQLQREVNRQRLETCTVALLDSDSRRRDAMKRDLRAHVGRVHAASSITGLIEAHAQLPCDAVLLVSEPARDPGVPQMLRSSGYEGHVIWLEGPDPPAASEDDPANETGSDPRVHRLHGELTPQHVLDKLQDIFTAEQRSAPDGPHASDAAPLRAAVLQGIHGQAAVLREAAGAQETRRVAQLCQLIADTAAAVELDTLADSARELTFAHDAPPPPDTLVDAVERLLRELGETQAAAA